MQCTGRSTGHCSVGSTTVVM